MNNKSVLKVAGINGQPVTVEDWTVSDQITTAAIHGLLGAIPFESRVRITLNNRDKCIEIETDGSISLRTTISHSDLGQFAFLAETGAQKAHDLYDVMSSVISAYNDACVRRR